MRKRVNPTARSTKEQPNCNFKDAVHIAREEDITAVPTADPIREDTGTTVNTGARETVITGNIAAVKIAVIAITVVRGSFVNTITAAVAVIPATFAFIIKPKSI